MHLSALPNEKEGPRRLLRVSDRPRVYPGVSERAHATTSFLANFGQNQTTKRRSGCSRSALPEPSSVHLREDRISTKSAGSAAPDRRRLGANQNATHSSHQNCHKSCNRSAGGNASRVSERKVRYLTDVRLAKLSFFLPDWPSQ
jgi:hypothetical protein